MNRNESEWEAIFSQARDDIDYSAYTEELEEDVRGTIRDPHTTLAEKEQAVSFASDYVPQAALARLELELDESIEDDE